MEILFTKKLIPENFVLKLNASFIQCNADVIHSELLK
jgi:hypothetical protein